ncbi:MAG: hypothetical protein EA362_11940 [Saprospirales bacterium]|nr:MAG: hypothetical protein EA362_11940 [Saprospirales bacterium]
MRPSNFLNIKAKNIKSQILFVLIVILCLFNPTTICAMWSQEENRFLYSQHFEDGLMLEDFIAVYPHNDPSLSIEDIILLPDSVFYTLNNVPSYLREFSSFWLKFDLTNDTDEKRSDYIGAALLYDTVEIYSIKNNVISYEIKTGYNIHPKEKRVPSRRSLYNFDLYPSETITFFIRVSPNEYHIDRTNSIEWSLFRIFIFEDFYLDYSNLFYHHLGKMFMLSFLILFSLFSLVMFFSFRERIFLYYSILMLFIALYFLDLERILDLFVFFPRSENPRLGNKLFTSGILLFLYLFISQYLNLKSAMYKFNQFFFYITIFIGLFGIFHYYILSNSSFLGSNIHNSLLLFYIIVSFVPIVTLSLKRQKEGKILLYSMMLLFLGSLTFVSGLLGIIQQTNFTNNSFQWGAIAFSGTLFYGLFDKINSIQKEKLKFKIEKEKTDDLLYNILPHEVATELKEKGFCEAKDYTKVSVLFTDFKDFTTTSTQLSAKELVHEVNTCFVAFDHIIEKYKVEKIKTIGDSYMAASGLETQSKTIVSNIVFAAIEMQEFLKKRNAELLLNNQSGFEMRIGIHTGPVVAGIVGVKKFQYDIWGDTVNTASRIETHGQVGKVNISDTTYQLIKDEPDLDFEEREEIEVKGKGKLKMWFVSLRADKSS